MDPNTKFSNRLIDVLKLPAEHQVSTALAALAITFAETANLEDLAPRLRTFSARCPRVFKFLLDSGLADLIDTRISEGNFDPLCWLAQQCAEYRGSQETPGGPFFAKGAKYHLFDPPSGSGRKLDMGVWRDDGPSHTQELHRLITCIQSADVTIFSPGDQFQLCSKWIRENGLRVTKANAFGISFDNWHEGQLQA